jgi:hypothetical protein
MLTKLMPDQVSNFWDVIKYAIEESLPPIVGEHPDKMNRILSSILCGKTDCWASYRKDKDNIIFEAVCLTRFIYDDASCTRNLLIYCLYGYEKTVEKSWSEAFLALAKYAKFHKCNEIVSYTDVPYMIDKAKAFGGDTRYTFVSFNVNKTVKIINSLWGNHEK